MSREKMSIKLVEGNFQVVSVPNVAHLWRSGGLRSLLLRTRLLARFATALKYNIGGLRSIRNFIVVSLFSIPKTANLS